MRRRRSAVAGGRNRARGGGPQERGPSLWAGVVGISTSLLLFFVRLPERVQGAPRGRSTCNPAEGTWVAAPSLPWYTAATCTAPAPRHCAKEGGKNLSYQKLRWQPSGCTSGAYRRLTPRSLAGTLRGKVVAVVGDCLATDFTTALKCLLGAAPRGDIHPFTWRLGGKPHSAARVHAYNITVARTFAQNIALAENIPGVGRGHKIHLDKLDPTVEALLAVADVIVFNAHHWWNIPTNQYVVKGKRQALGYLDAYGKVLRTLVKRLDRIQFRGRAFLLTPSPSHYSLPPGASSHRGKCQVYRPLAPKQARYQWKHDRVSQAFISVEKRVVAESSRLHLVDVTRMSEARADGHPANIGQGPGDGNDCTHWCEAGVPDAWVEAIYNRLRH